MAVTFLTNEDKSIIDEQIGKLSEEIAELRGENEPTIETVTETGVVVSIDAPAGAELDVSAATTEPVTLVRHGKNYLKLVEAGGQKRDKLDGQ